MLTAGDVVMLKSVGPKMTVLWIDGGDAHCAWFVDGEVKTSSFPTAALQKLS
ncbi:YodC family protein [Roseateles chitinivorans]|uniref:YodC family protein n=1 Tax=Roseateles chitinivorans TaxID=2917965 RepID=UPI003D664AD1